MVQATEKVYKASYSQNEHAVISTFSIVQSIIIDNRSFFSTYPHIDVDTTALYATLH